mgnify:CR=1 FL=1
MGIKSLTYLIKQKSPDSIQSVDLNHFKNKTLAIDTSIFLYQSLMNVRNNGEYLRNKDGKIVSHIVGLFNKTINYLSHGITPIYIFDGKPPQEKYDCIQERNKKAKDSKKKMNETKDETEKLKLEKSTIRIKKEYIEDLKQLFNLMGVSYIHPDGEAEAFAGELCRIGYVDGVITEDMDTFSYGCHYVIRKCIDKKEKKDMLSVFNLSKILSDFNMNQKEFNDMCILCGCDYCSTIPKVGPIRAFQHIQKYKSIENLIESNKIKNIPDDFLQKYKSARKCFEIFADQVDINNLNIYNSSFDSIKLKNYLINDCNMSESRVDSALSKNMFEFL